MSRDWLETEARELVLDEIEVVVIAGTASITCSLLDIQRTIDEDVERVPDEELARAAARALGLPSARRMVWRQDNSIVITPALNYI
jgi:hypothetical protein